MQRGMVGDASGVVASSSMVERYRVNDPAEYPEGQGSMSPGWRGFAVDARSGRRRVHSHSIVAGGFDEMS